MKRKVLFSLTALAAAALTSFTAYKSFTPQLSEADILLNENIEALTDDEEGIPVKDCFFWGNGGESEYVIECDSRTTTSTIYPCISDKRFVTYSSRGTCYKKE